MNEKLKKYIAICSVCKKEYFRSRSDKKFCSSKCRTRACRSKKQKSKK